MRFASLTLLAILVSVSGLASEELAREAFDRMQWFSEKPIKASFVKIYGHTSKLNKNLHKKLSESAFARVINVYDHVQFQKNVKFSANRVLRGYHLGVPIEITRRTNRHDRKLVRLAMPNRSKPAREVLEFRVHTLRGSAVVYRQFGDAIQLKFPIAKASARLARQVTALEMKGTKVVRIEVVHNHPVQAVEFYDQKQKSTGYFYNSFSQQDLDIGKAIQEAFPSTPVEVAILIGLVPEDLFRVSYFPGRIQTAGM